ncbi:MAG: hypothetical protein ABEK04_04880, partial [Candidatus Nanohalobium sp.]
IRIRQKKTLPLIGDKVLTLQVKKNGGKKTDILLDTNGWLGDYQCEGDKNGGGTNPNNDDDSYSKGKGRIRLNTTINSRGVIPRGEWLVLNPNKVQHFRVLEVDNGENGQSIHGGSDQEENKDEVRIQVRQTGG